MAKRQKPKPQRVDTPLKDQQNVQMEVVEKQETWDVAWAYAALSNGTVPPVIRGEDLEDYA